MCENVRKCMQLSVTTDMQQDDNNDIGIDSPRVAQQVQEQLARRRMSRQALADKARISLSTLEKALAGKRPFTLATTLRLEEALTTSLRDTTPDNGAPVLADESLGAYSRAAVRWLEGAYLTLRPSFSRDEGVYSYLTTIRWIAASGHLGYSESKRIDTGFEQAGFVSMPHLSGHIYLVTNECGQYRMIMLGRPSVDGELRGILSTLEVGAGSQLVPVACPVTLAPLDREHEPQFGLIEPDSAQHERYRERLSRTIDNDYARFHR